MNRGRPGWVWVLTVVSLAGCGATPVASKPTSSAPPAPAPLPKEALLSLNELSPPVERPAVKPGDLPLDPRAGAILHEAQTHFDKGQFASALAKAEKAGRYDPHSLQVRRLMGLGHMALGDAARGRGHLVAVAEKAGDDARVQVLLGRVAEASARPVEAVTRYRIGLVCSDAGPDTPTRNECLLRLGELLGQRGYVAAALECFQELMENLDRHGDTIGQAEGLKNLLDQPEVLLFRQGQLLMKLRRPAEAETVLDAAYRQNKTFSPAAKLLAAALVKTDQLDRAEALLLEVLRGPMASGRAAEMILLVYRATNDPAGPGRLLERYRAYHPVPTAGPLLAVAHAAYRLGATDEAIAMLATHAEDAEDGVAVASRLAAWLLTDGRGDEAMEALANLLVRHPGAAGVAADRVAQGPAETLGSEFARRWAATAEADRSPRKFALHYLAGMAALRPGKEDLAQAQLEQAIQADPTFVAAYEALARRYIERRRFDLVEAVAERALTEKVDAHVGYYLRGWAQLEKGQLDGAIKDLTLAVSEKGTHAPSRRLLGTAYLRDGKVVLAERQFTAAVKLTRDERAAELLVFLLLQRHEQQRGRSPDHLGKARKTVQQLLAVDRNNITALRLLSVVQQADGKYLAARRTVARLVALAPDDVKARLAKVRVEVCSALVLEQIGKRRFGRAVADLRHALKVDRGNVETLVLLSQVYAARQRYTDAADVLAEAYDRQGDGEDLTQLYAATLRKAGRADAAADVVAKWKQDAKTLSEWLVFYVMTMCQAGRSDEALSALRESTEPTSRGSAPYLAAVAYVHTGAGRFDVAEKVLGDALGDKNAAPIEREMLNAAMMETLAEAKRYDRLEALAAQWLNDLPPEQWLDRYRAEPQRPLVNPVTFAVLMHETPSERQRLRGVVTATNPVSLAMAWLQAVGESGRAEKLCVGHIDRLAAQGGKHAELAGVLRAELIRGFVLAGQVPRARRLYEEFLAVDEKNFDLLMLVQLLEDPSRPDENRHSVDRLRQALALQPNNEKANNNLAYSLADRGVELDEAERLARKALAIEASPYIQDTMGWVKYKQGQFAQALKFLLPAFNHPRGDNAVVYDHIADTYWRLGRKAEAVAAWTEAADLAEAELSQDDALPDEEIRRVLRLANKKVRAVEGGKAPPVAPVGQGVEVPAGMLEKVEGMLPTGG